MNLHSALKECWGLNSVSKTRVNGDTYLIVDNFRFFFWRNSSCGTDEIKVEIMHPDGDMLEIIHQLYGSTADWTHWDNGPWNSALDKAYNFIKTANAKKKIELEEQKQTQNRLQLEQKQAKVKKFADLFDKT
jgi:hypothetical protein